ncbi:MAG: RHS repeat-associated core domain-containing protein [Treponema sp.]|nr:RHS repeat-associated core domain-containing protein [Treponema sp.]
MSLDKVGNVIAEQDGSFESNGTDSSYHEIIDMGNGVYATDYGWGLFKDYDPNGGVKGKRYCRFYKWNERNQLISSVDARYNTSYVYGQDGQRSNKYTDRAETLYFNRMWTHRIDSGNRTYGGQTAKNIYLGETRIVTKLNSGKDPVYQEEYYKRYYYHSDHLGSASLISDYKGDEYQRIEYTPYGETWVEKTSPEANLNFLPYKFTAKELDEETGLYYYGARYLDPKYSRWISTDSALGDYVPQAPINEEARKHNQNLPGMGGVFNHINGNLYHYAANNPVKYTDPDGNKIIISNNCKDTAKFNNIIEKFNKVKNSDTISGREFTEIENNETYTLNIEINNGGATGYDSNLDKMLINANLLEDYPTYPDNPDLDTNFEATFAHEGHHAYEDMTNTRDSRAGFDGKANRELNASKVENNYRAKNSMKQRERYRITWRTKNGLGQIVTHSRFITIPQWNNDKNCFEGDNEK